MMPQDLLEGNPWEKGTKIRVKEWVKENVRRRGLDSILWGRWEECDEGEEEEEEGAKETARLTAGGSPKNRDPPTSREQMRKLGEPRRKICRIEEEQMPEDNPSQRGNSPTWPPSRAEGPLVRRLTSPTPPDGNKRQGARKRKEDHRTKREPK